MNPSEQRPTPETDAMHAKQGLTHASYREFARKLECERDKLKQWKDEMMQVGGWWLAVDEAVREHPDAIAGHNVSDTALRFIRERDEARKHLRDANRGAQVNARINQSMAGKLNEAAKQLEAMREAIGAAHLILNNISALNETTEVLNPSMCMLVTEQQSLTALAKLQPFLKP